MLKKATIAKPDTAINLWEYFSMPKYIFKWPYASSEIAG